MIQQIIRVGNSFAVTIPKSVIEEKNLEAGQKVNVTVEPVTSQAIHEITPEFLSWLKKFNTKYKAALTELAKK